MIKLTRSLAVAVCLVGCGPSSTTIKRVVIDCTVENRAQIGALVGEFTKILVGGKPDWDAILDKAIPAGVTIGGCALAELAQNPPKEGSAARMPEGLYTPPSDRTARSVLEEFRKRQQLNAVYRTAKGDL